MGFASQQAAGPFLPSVVTGYLMECFLFYILLPPECSSGPASQLAVDHWPAAVANKAWGLPVIPGGLLKSEIRCVASHCRRGAPFPYGAGSGVGVLWPPAKAQLGGLPASHPSEPFSPEGRALADLLGLASAGLAALGETLLL